MTVSLRTAFRQAAVSALDATPLLAGRVMVDEYRAIEPSRLPGVIVSVTDSVELDGTFGDSLARSIVVQLRGLAKQGDGLSDKLDELSHVAELAMLATGLMVQGRTVFPDAVRTIKPDPSAALDLPVGELQTDFVFRVFTTRANPGVLA